MAKKNTCQLYERQMRLSTILEAVIQKFMVKDSRFELSMVEAQKRGRHPALF